MNHVFGATGPDGIHEGENLYHRRKRASSMIGDGEQPAKAAERVVRELGETLEEPMSGCLEEEYWVRGEWTADH